MIRARLERDSTSDHGTLGVLVARFLPGPIHIIEPPWRNNARNRSCIPEGIYDVVPHVSPRFGRCLLVTGVPDRSHILFHAGNLGGDVDKGFRSHTAGCLLPGTQRGTMRVGERGQRAVLASITALRHLMTWCDRRPFTLEIVDA